MHAPGYKRRRRPLVSEFTEQVRRRLAEIDMSYAELAQKTGLSRQYIYKVMNHGHNFTMEVAEKIAKAIGLKITVSSDG